MKIKEQISMVIFFLILGSFWSTALVFVDNATKPYIEKYQAEKLRKSILGALDIQYEAENIEQVFEANIEVIERDGKEIYRTKAKGEVAFNISGSGSQGPISGVLALESDLKTIKGITIVSHVETPVLGDSVLSWTTLDKFIGKLVVPQIRILPGGGASGNNEVDGITGATLTCKAFEQILNTVSKEYISLISAEGK